jgi:phage protein D
MAAIALAPVVSLGGSPLSAAWLEALVELRVERQFSLPGRVTLRFSDPGYALVDGQAITIGTAIKVADATNSAVLITAEATSVAVEQRSRDQPELVVVGHDRSHRLGRSTGVQTFAQMSYSDVVTQLAGQAGLTPSVESTGETFDYFMQADTGLGMLSELARRVGFDWWVDDTTLYFKKPAAGATVKLAMPGDLRSLTVKATGHSPDTFVVEGWDRTQQELVTATAPASSADAATLARSGLADQARDRSARFGTGTFTVTGLGAHTAAEAKTVGEALATRAAAAAVSIQGLTDGNAAIVPGAVVDISGAGRSVSGRASSTSCDPAPGS